MILITFRHFKKIRQGGINLLRGITDEDNTASPSHLMMLFHLQRSGLFPGRLELDPGVTGRKREKDKPVGRSGPCCPGAFATAAPQFLDAPFKICGVDSFRCHDQKKAGDMPRPLLVSG